MAYSYGCILALEALALLERDGYTAEVILIDGAVDMFKPLIKQQIGDPDDTALFQTNILCAIISQFVNIETATKQRVSFLFVYNTKTYFFFKDSLLACDTFEERLNLTMLNAPYDEHHSLEYRKLMIMAFYTRILAMAKYTSQITEIKSSVEILRPETQSVYNVKDDYNISKIVGRPLEVKWFKGTHQSIRESLEVADYINEWLERFQESNKG